MDRGLLESASYALALSDQQRLTLCSWSATLAVFLKDYLQAVLLVSIVSVRARFLTSGSYRCRSLCLRYVKKYFRATDGLSSWCRCKDQRLALRLAAFGTRVLAACSRNLQITRRRRQASFQHKLIFPTVRARFLPDLVLSLRSVVFSIDVLRACMSEHELIAPKCLCQCISVSYERAVWLVECHGRSLMIDA